jgi:hypothetical protein
MVGTFTKTIRRMQASFKRESEGLLVPTATKKQIKAGGHPHPMIPEHEGMPWCEHCDDFHTIDQHRFHGTGSHLRTHGEEGGGIKVASSRGSGGKKKTELDLAWDALSVGHGIAKGRAMIKGLGRVGPIGGVGGIGKKKKG